SPWIRGLTRLQKRGLARSHPCIRIDMKGDQLGKQPEHADGLGVLQPGWPWVDGTKCAEETTVEQNDRHRNITLKAIHRWGRVVAISLVFGDVIDDDRFFALTDLVADGGFDL